MIKVPTTANIARQLARDIDQHVISAQSFAVYNSIFKGPQPKNLYNAVTVNIANELDKLRSLYVTLTGSSYQSPFEHSFTYDEYVKQLYGAHYGGYLDKLADLKRGRMPQIRA